MESCVFSYYISESSETIKELKNRYSFGKYTIFTDVKTPFVFAGNENSACAVFGFAVDVLTGESENLAHKIAFCCSGMSDVVAFEKKLGGKYIILYRDKDQYYILGDATCSIPVFYTAEGAFACSSNSRYIVNSRRYLPDRELQQIRDSGDISQAMPYDITQYREIRQLIPNHYLSVNGGAAVRFVNAEHLQPTLTAQSAANIVAPMIDTISKYYKSLFRVYCPITSGRDSRAVLAFLAGDDPCVPCYTIRHLEHSDNTQDIVVPKRLCLENRLMYEQINDAEIPEALKKETDCLLGKNNYSERTLRIAKTIQEHYGDGAVINGDIIGQVGKCSLHRDIPSCFATPRYFQCKLHNYSSKARKQLKRWLQDIKNSKECVNTFDLFSVENRMGRWAAQENLIYNSLGQIYLNIFNSRSIIYVWTAVSRTERKKSAIHINLIKNKMPSLLSVPFEADESMLVRFSKASGLTYLAFSYAKYYMERWKFKREKRYEKTDHNS